MRFVHDFEEPGLQEHWLFFAFGEGLKFANYAGMQLITDESTAFARSISYQLRRPLLKKGGGHHNTKSQPQMES